MKRGDQIEKLVVFSSLLAWKLAKKLTILVLLFYKVLFFFALFLFRETLTDVKIETEKLTKNIYPFFFFACKLTNESYVTRRTVARPNLTLLANTSYPPPHPPSVHSLYSCCPCIKPLSVDWTTVLQTQAVWWMNTTRYIVDTSIYRRGLYYYINNFELPRLAKHSSIIQLSNSRMKEDEFSVPRVRN